MSCHVMLWYVKLCYVMLSYVMLSYVMLCYDMLCHVMLCHIMSRHVMSCHVMSCHVMSCHVMSCHVMSCHVMSCHVMSCHVMSCHVMSCHIPTWQILLPSWMSLPYNSNVLTCHILSCTTQACPGLIPSSQSSSPPSLCYYSFQTPIRTKNTPLSDTGHDSGKKVTGLGLIRTWTQGVESPQLVSTNRNRSISPLDRLEVNSKILQCLMSWCLYVWIFYFFNHRIIILVNWITKGIYKILLLLSVFWYTPQSTPSYFKCSYFHL